VVDSFAVAQCRRGCVVFCAVQTWQHCDCVGLADDVHQPVSSYVCELCQPRTLSAVSSPHISKLICSRNVSWVIYSRPAQLVLGWVTVCGQVNQLQGNSAFYPLQYSKMTVSFQA